MGFMMRVLIVVLFLMIVAFAGPVEAKEGVLGPLQAEWDIIEVSAAQGESPKICAIGNRFEGGIRLYFSGTAEKLNHISLTVETGDFMDGQMYDVRYDIPKQQREDFQAKAAGNAMLVRAAPGEKDLTKALLAAQEIKITVKGEKPLTLDLPGIGLGLYRFSKCVGGKAPVYKDYVQAEAEDVELDVAAETITPIPDDRIAEAPSVPEVNFDLAVDASAPEVGKSARVPPPPVAVTPEKIAMIEPASGAVVPRPKSKPSFRPQPRQRYTEVLAQERKEDQNFAVKVKKAALKKEAAAKMPAPNPTMVLKAPKPKAGSGFLGPKTDIITHDDVR